MAQASTQVNSWEGMAAEGAGFDYHREGYEFYWETDLSGWLEHACRIAKRELTSEEKESYLGHLSSDESVPLSLDPVHYVRNNLILEMSIF